MGVVYVIGSNVFGGWEMKTNNHYYVADQYGQGRIFWNQLSPRQAALAWFDRYQELNNPKLFKVYCDGLDGQTYVTGYGYGKTWLTIGTVDMMRVQA